MLEVALLLVLLAQIVILSAVWDLNKVLGNHEKRLDAVERGEFKDTGKNKDKVGE